jgi:hypothetical protein
MRADVLVPRPHCFDQHPSILMFFRMEVSYTV